jgi:hypothetical protein
MPRPTTKKELLAISAKRFTELNALIDEMPPAQRGQEFQPGTMNRSIRDVLGHVHHWHLLFLDWYSVGMKGGKPDMPAKGYTWAQNAELNSYIHGLYTAVPLRTMRIRCAKSHAALHALIERHSDTELFTKQRYPWTGTTSLGAYLISATSAHYEWAIRLIKRAMVR